MRLAEGRHTGTFSAVGPRHALTMGDFLDECHAESGSDAQFTWMSDDQLMAAGVAPWTELPLWIPESDMEFGGIHLADNGRAIDAGLTFRPVAETVRATLEWDRGEGTPSTASSIRATPLTAEREGELLGGRLEA